MVTLFTGATGFLGSHLLARSLLLGQRSVALVRRAPDIERQRIRLALQATDFPEAAELVDTVRLVQIDLSAARLGLDNSTFLALAAEVEAIWHCAADIEILGKPDRLNRTNVIGTRTMRSLADATGQDSHFIYVSTAFVAGARMEGIVKEDDLDDSLGFLSPYEETKYTAEKETREWAERTGRRLTVFRPSLLLTHRRPIPGGPTNTGATAGTRLSELARIDPSVVTGRPLQGGRAVVRLPGREDALINILQVECAADIMISAAARKSPAHIESFHVVHPRETEVRRLASAMMARCPWLDVRIAPDHRGDSPLERMLIEEGAGILAYTHVRRTYDRSRITAAVRIPDPPAIDDAYLRASLGQDPDEECDTAAIPGGLSASW
ncbi:NAD-dependent epimerase/dehydratase family protein [Actinomadura sp. KC216]|uniref:SDR family oxidoreductase n=1 Tax=Actinomadura sp. KC216 TaxID=2530370 RepID=UPI00104CBD9A|nr:SDR family oxidoreductase [Actinomadura sp. KC216]TDB84361.1 NAD-dependent epimerase/dehydratase family protein [Actinomadura sp. KC216]